MGTVILSVMTSLDGMFDGPGEGFERIDWFRADDEWLDYSVELLDQVDTLLFGRRAFEGMEQFWPAQTDPVGRRMNERAKVGFSRQPRTTTWANARFSTAPVAELTALRAREGGGARVMGSGGLATTLTGHGLIDEYRFAINPVALGAGTPLFPPGSPRVAFDTVGTRVFTSGIVELRCVRQAVPAGEADRP